MRPDLVTDSMILGGAEKPALGVSARPHILVDTMGYYAHLIEHVPFCCLGFNRAGGVQFANSTGAQLIGLERHELLGRQFASFIADADRVCFSNLLGNAFITNLKQACELKLLPVDGAPVYVRIEATVAPDSSDCIAALMLISDRKMAEPTQEIRDLEERLRRSKVEAVGQLAGGIAHGFNNLLTVIEGYSSLLLDAPEVFANRSREFLTEIRTATACAAQLTQKLLALGRRQLLHPEAFDLNELVISTLGSMASDSIEIETSLDPQLRQVWADRAQIAQALANLTLNSLEALVDGGRLLVHTECVELSLRDVISMSQIVPGKYALLSVSDTGCGMSEEVLARAFEPFFTTKPSGQGTGLGLAAVHGVVTQSGGHVDVTSKAGMGTCVNLYLPQEKMALDSISQRSKPPSPQNGSETILLVEDENAVRNIVRIVLTRYGYNVLEASNGNEALEIVRTYELPIQILLTDVVMPGMHGPEVAKEVVSKMPSIRVIFMSGYVDDAQTREGLADATASFIQKPFSSEDLAHKVRAVLDA